MGQSLIIIISSVFIIIIIIVHIDITTNISIIIVTNIIIIIIIISGFELVQGILSSGRARVLGSQILTSSFGTPDDED